MKKYTPLKVTVFESGEENIEYVDNFLGSELIENLESNVISQESKEYQKEYYKEKKELDLTDVDDINRFLEKFYEYGWLSVEVKENNIKK